MRFATLTAIAAAAAIMAGAFASPADAQRKKRGGPAYESVTVIDGGVRRTRITVRPRSYLDAGTEVLPGSQHYHDYAYWPRHSAWDNIDPTKSQRFPLPDQWDLPGWR